jgi:uncharacterized protein YciI
MTLSSKHLYAIYALDDENSDERREELYSKHRWYLSNHPTQVDITLAGPLLDDHADGSRAIGSLFIVSASSMEEVERFHASDPFAVGGVWSKVQITPFVRRR